MLKTWPDGRRPLGLSYSGCTIHTAIWSRARFRQNAPGDVQIGDGEVPRVENLHASCGQVLSREGVQDKRARQRFVAIGAHGNSAGEDQEKRLVVPLATALEKDGVA